MATFEGKRPSDTSFPSFRRKARSEKGIFDQQLKQYKQPGKGARFQLREFTILKKTQQILHKYLLLKKNTTKSLDSCCMKEEIFKADFAELFHLSTKYAHSCMKNEEDKTFLVMQQEDPLSYRMAGVNLKQLKKLKRG